AHQYIQKQFIEHTVVKQYTAILDGILTESAGLIDLPLRVDLDDRPRQVVCYQHGKPAQTKFNVIGHEQGRTRIHFFPITGRTHQLRVHAAHHNGLHTPILGDDLYGQRADRLHLHAGRLAFVHPRTGEYVTFTAEDPFYNYRPSFIIKKTSHSTRGLHPSLKIHESIVTSVDAL